MVSPSRSATPGGELTRSKDSGAKQLAENSAQSPEGTVEILNDTICQCVVKRGGRTKCGLPLCWLCHHLHPCQGRRARASFELATFVARLTKSQFGQVCFSDVASGVYGASI